MFDLFEVSKQTITGNELPSRVACNSLTLVFSLLTAFIDFYVKECLPKSTRRERESDSRRGMDCLSITQMRFDSCSRNCQLGDFFKGSYECCCCRCCCWLPFVLLMSEECVQKIVGERECERERKAMGENELRIARAKKKQKWKKWKWNAWKDDGISGSRW